MPDALPLTLRIKVRGASTVAWLSPMGGPRSDLGFPRVIERELGAAGRPAVVDSYAIPGEPTVELVRTWEEHVLAWSPDVIVLMTGHYETIHLLMPHWLERHANSVRWVDRPIRTFYRRRLLRPAWKVLAQIQLRTDRRFPRLRDRRVHAAVADIERFITRSREVGSPLVIVMEAPLPGSRARRWFPGMAHRIPLLNQELARMVASFACDEVRLFPTTRHAAEYADGDLDRAVPDGIHFTPPLHERIGRELADDIAKWAASQPHLLP